MRFLMSLGIVLSSLMVGGQELPRGVVNELRPFTTDGCSKSEDGAWKHCCVAHDISYWMGGSWDDKKAADQELRSCMVKAGSGETLAQQYYIVVRVAGAFLQKTKYRWGNGWKYVRPMKPHSPEELVEIESHKPELEEAMRLKLDGAPGAPMHLPTLTGDYCMDQIIFEISEMTQGFGVEKITVNKLTEAMVLGGGYKYIVGINECKNDFELPLKVSPQDCQKKIYTAQGTHSMFQIKGLQKQVRQCFKQKKR